MRASHSFIFVLFFALTSCGTPPKVPVSTRDTISVREQTEKIGGGHVTHVRKGDTLYSIAFGAGLSHSDVAAWNYIDPDDVLLAGQKLRLTRPLNFQEKPKETVVVSVPVERPQTPVVKQEPIIAKPSVAKPVVIKPPIVKQTENLPKIQLPQETELNSFPTDLHWQWPTKGKVNSSFSVARGNKGINIAGRRGQDVVASEAGKVVYAGNGLRGYGNLLIIKHNEQYLSAYAHNDSMLVREGQFVKQGQKISVMGVAKSGKPMLHFEIRLQGKPVDPVKFLPKS